MRKWFQKDKPCYKRNDRQNNAGLDNRKESGLLKSQLPMELARIEGELGGIRFPDVAELLELLIIDPCDENLREILVEDASLRIQESQVLPNPFRSTAPTRYDDLDGEIVLGQTMSGTIYGINPDSLTTHALCLGSSGYGKTNFSVILTSQLTQRRR
jgi:hypothetical protein